MSFIGKNEICGALHISIFMWVVIEFFILQYSTQKGGGGGYDGGGADCGGDGCGGDDGGCGGGD